MTYPVSDTLVRFKYITENIFWQCKRYAIIYNKSLIYTIFNIFNNY